MEEDIVGHSIGIYELSVQILRLWKPIAAFAIAVAVLLGAYASIGNLNREYSEALIVNRTESLKSSDAGVKDLQALLEDDSKLLSQRQAYLQKSVLCNLDAEAIPTARAVLHIELPAGDQGDETQTATSSILVAYRSELQGDAVIDAVNNALVVPMSRVFLHEIIRAEFLESNDIRVSVMHTDMDSASRILESILTYLREYSILYLQPIHAHTLKITERQKVLSNDASVIETREFYQNSIQELLARIDDTNMQIRELVIADLDRTTYRHPMQYTGLGFLIGLILGISSAIIWVVFGPFVDGEEIVASRIGCRVLCTITVPGRGMRSDERRLKRRLTGVDSSVRYLENLKYAYHRIIQSLRSERPDIEKTDGTILLATCTPYLEISDIADGIQNLHSTLQPSWALRYTAGGDLLGSADALDALDRASAAVLLVVRRRSTYTSISRGIERITLAGKPLLGLVIVDAKRIRSSQG